MKLPIGLIFGTLILAIGFSFSKELIPAKDIQKNDAPLELKEIIRPDSRAILKNVKVINVGKLGMINADAIWGSRVVAGYQMEGTICSFYAGTEQGRIAELTAVDLASLKPYRSRLLTAFNPDWAFEFLNSTGGVALLYDSKSDMIQYAEIRWQGKDKTWMGEVVAVDSATLYQIKGIIRIAESRF